MPQITQLSYSNNGSIFTKVRVVYPKDKSTSGYYVDLYTYGSGLEVSLTCRTYGTGWTKEMSKSASVPSTHSSLELEFSNGIKTTGDITTGSNVSLNTLKNSFDSLSGNVNSIGKYDYYGTNFTACPITVPSGTKKCIGYFTFTKTGTFLLKICVRWGGTSTSSQYSVGVNTDRITTPKYDLYVYQDSSTLWGNGGSFVQQFSVFTNVTNTSTIIAIWVCHNKGSDALIDANWSGAMHIH